ncbi:DNA-binding response regulator, OmpR family, contains REC and winged-helix (wHTH) domain [Sphingomonas sp. NFR04]|uniref:response regulator n=1 Tax=Sphingomonas sp. NFR04 TaxID=1566283 RepID=UPI0008F15747|nr:response regulator transcription factor [Sphingomonas sp. NFR04]SFK33458.1 DNA-binding response regulator, OmpR family, contains REC and winged-helix (wHTH) domain [Sphingomonas sp. NFR04]
MRILLVEDDPDLGPAIARALRAEHCAVDLAADGVDAQHLGETEAYDAAVLDLGMPGRTGAEILTAWRANGRALPVLVLTAREAWADKVTAFKAGADDYLTKPFRVEELMMRLRALVRRAAGHAQTRIECGPLAFESQTGQFELDGLPLKLTAFEWRVLSQLILRREVVIERLELLERVYEGDADVDSNSLEVIIGRLRRKIGAERIETVRGRGYRLTCGAQPA